MSGKIRDQRIIGTLVLTALVSCLLVASTSRAGIIYSQDWESGVDGQSILAAPYSFGVGGGAGAFVVQDTTPLGTDLAVAARNAGDGGGSTGAASIGITTPSLTPSSKYILTATVRASGANDSFIGLSETGGFNGTGAYIGVTELPTPATWAWHLDARGIRSGILSDVVVLGTSGQLLGTNVDLTLEFDIDSNTVSAKVTDGVTTLSGSFVGGNDFSGIGYFAIQQFGAGINVDDVLIQEVVVPEPATASLLEVGTAGLLMLGRQRRRQLYNE